MPVGYEVFPGSTFEGHTLKPILNNLKSRYKVEDVIFVADRGLLSKDNLTCLEERQVNYIVGGKLKTLPKQVQHQILQQRKSLHCLSDKNPKSYEFEHQNRRRVMSYNHKRAEKDSSDREKAIKRLMKKAGKNRNPKALLNNYGHKKYLKITGKTDLSVDQDKVQQDAQWDGLHAVVTNPGMSASKLFDHYRRLWQVEESFRITRHDLKVRPVYHWTPKRIRWHLAIAFTAFSLVCFLSVRVKLQYKKLSPQVIRNALLHIQQSIVKHEKTCERYCIPSKVSKEAEKSTRP